MSSRGQALKPYHLCDVKLSPLPLLTSLILLLAIKPCLHHLQGKEGKALCRMCGGGHSASDCRGRPTIRSRRPCPERWPDLEETAPTNGEIKWPLVKNTLQSSEHALLHRVAGRRHAAGIGMLGGVFSAPSSVMIS